MSKTIYRLDPKACSSLQKKLVATVNAAPANTKRFREAIKKAHEKGYITCAPNAPPALQVVGKSGDES